VEFVRWIAATACCAVRSSTWKTARSKQIGISTICNIIGSIRMARFLNLGPDDNVVTVATDGFDRYPWALADLEKRRGPLTDAELAACFEGIFRVDSRRSWTCGLGNRRIASSARRRKSGPLSAIPAPIWKP
jgi:hypothetical protein